MSLDDLLLTLKAGKGNWGHRGRPGKRGGSSSKSGFAPGSSQDTSIQGDAIRRFNQNTEDLKKQNTPEKTAQRVVDKVREKYGDDYAKQVNRWIKDVPDRVSDKGLYTKYAKWAGLQGHLTVSASSVLNDFGKSTNGDKKEITKMGQELFIDDGYRARW